MRPNIGDDGIRSISSLGLAHVGDAVLELMVRTWLCLQGISTAKNLHCGTVEYVSAKAQAAASDRLIPILNEDELSVFKRGRNAHVKSAPRNSTLREYHTATGIEALFGFIYLKGDTQRLAELFETVIRT